MSKMEKYIGAFKEGLRIEESMINSSLVYQGIPEWDSIGHMEIVAELEDAFDIMLETDDVIDLSSFDKGIEILEKYGITM